jgi:hypothetical protein
MYHLICAIHIPSHNILSTFFLLKTCSSALFPQEVLAQPPTHHHVPWLAQSHVTPYTCTLFLPSAGSSTTLVPQMTDEKSWTLAIVAQ